MRDPAYLEDFVTGQVYASGAYTMEQARMVAFAVEFDPQPAHTDEAGAAASQFGRLVASGWHTGSVAMRLLIVDALPPIAGGGIGAGVEQMTWLQPVFPGDTLQLTAEITGARAMRSRPGKGLVNVRVEMTNQEGAVVLRMVTAVVVLTRPAVPSAG